METIDASAQINIRVQVGGVLIQQRACCSREGDRSARCRPLMAPVGVLMEIALHLLHDVSRCALSAERTARAQAFGCHCSCFLALAVRLCAQPALCFRLSRRSVLVCAGTHLVPLGALLFSALVSCLFSSFFCSALHQSLHSSRLCYNLCSAYFISALATPLARRVRLLHIHNHAQ